MPATTPKVLIIGTGISGLTVAQGLRKNNIPFRIFERDPDFAVRAQGYRIRIPGAGITALEETLSPELLVQVKESCAPVLRSVLLRGLEDHIEFGKKFLSYEITESGVTVRFSDGTEAHGSLLVGADGARSAVRKQFLPDHGLLDTQGRLIYGKTPLTAELEASFDKGAMGGMTMLRDSTRGIPMRFDVKAGESRAKKGLPEDYVYWVLGWRKDVLAIADGELFHLSHEDAAALSQKLTANWHPSLRVLFALQDVTQTSALSILSVHPDIRAWQPSNRVTLLGDAVHTMSPTAGIGATTALRDAALLVKTLVEKGMGADAIGGFEREMRQYAGEAVRRSHGGGKTLYGMRSFEEMEPAVLE
ncbi:hypothetical protein B0H17DRAFT_1242682 [Mycena rosella]|uniref:FAD-binding domain-containing protein n=1 Tax=Mycena rosella TaxID=1033263 RepID=A0AAD7D0U2_MYCRO|nr:hypothetical protein B0H17DRAFT_1242682 [Mycena rosella]